MQKQRFVFVGGLHKSGTSLLAQCLAEHPRISSFHNTGVPEDEGQHLQTVFPPARALGGPGKFGFNPEAHLTESSPLVSEENRVQLIAQWGPHWDLDKEVLLEKSPPNLIRTRFLQALFPEAYFIILIRHPIAVAYATRKWSRTSIDSLIQHWLICHELFETDRPHINRLQVLHYEEFTERPQSSLDRLCAFLQLDPFRCQAEVRADGNVSYLRTWADQRDQEEALSLVREYDSRAARFGYHM